MYGLSSPKVFRSWRGEAVGEFLQMLKDSREAQGNGAVTATFNLQKGQINKSLPKMQMVLLTLIVSIARYC